MGFLLLFYAGAPIPQSSIKGYFNSNLGGTLICLVAAVADIGLGVGEEQVGRHDPPGGVERRAGPRLSPAMMFGRNVLRRRGNVDGPAVVAQRTGVSQDGRLRASKVV